MNAAGVLLIALVAFCAGRISLHRRIRGLEDQLEYARLHVDGADQALEPLRRIAWSAVHRTRRMRVKS